MTVVYYETKYTQIITYVYAARMHTASDTMTIDAHIPKAVQFEWPTKRARRKGFPALDMPSVVVVDTTYFLHVAALGEENAQGMTGMQYILTVFMPFLRMMQVFSIRYMIFVLDMATHVPKEKKETQDKRRHQSKNVPYPPGSTLGFAGIHLPSGAVVPVVPASLMATRSMRPQIMALFEKLICTHEEYAIPADTFVITDWETQGPMLIQRDGTAQRLHQHTRRQNMGEADVQVCHWALVADLRSMPLIAISEDGDWIPILLWLASDVNRQNIYLKKGRDNGYLHINECLAIMRGNAMKWSARDFLYSTILNGTDFLPRSSLMHRVRSGLIFWVVNSLSHSFPKFIDSLDGNSQSFEALLATIYDTHLLSQPKVEATDKPAKTQLVRSLEDIRQRLQSSKTALKIPTAQDLPQLFERFSFVISYWCKDWRAYARNSPPIHMEHLEAAAIVVKTPEPQPALPLPKPPQKFKFVRSAVAKDVVDSRLPLDEVSDDDNALPDDD
jgi:hypothetical protein